jgi:hypothetical protein
MGFNLRREVRDLLPSGGILTDKEARLLLELADYCNDATRHGKPGSEWLAKAADISDPNRVGEYFASIAAKWVEFRVPLGKTKDGREYYSYPGKRTAFRFPSREEMKAAPARKVPKKRPTKKVPEDRGPNMVPEVRGASAGMVPESPGAKVPEVRGANGPGTSGEWSRSFGDPSPQVFPQEEPSSLSSGDSCAVGTSPTVDDQTNPEREEIQNWLKTKNLDGIHRQLLAEHCGITNPDDADTLAYGADHLLPDGKPKGKAWWRAVAANGDLPAVVGQIYAAIADARGTAEPPNPPRPPWCGRCHEQTRLLQNHPDDRLRRCPDCHPHGNEGAALPEPDDRPAPGRGMCRTCRKAGEYVAAAACTAHDPEKE